VGTGAELGPGVRVLERRRLPGGDDAITMVGAGSKVGGGVVVGGGCLGGEMVGDQERK
jgi:hypothetical protein